MTDLQTKAQLLTKLEKERELVRLWEDKTELTQQKNNAYFERNQCVPALCKLALALGYKAGRAIHPKDDLEWEDDWRHMVFIDLPTGQVSWHFHDTEVWLIDWMPWYQGAWDGHTTPEKYKRLNALPIPNSI